MDIKIKEVWKKDCKYPADEAAQRPAADLEVSSFKVCFLRSSLLLSDGHVVLLNGRHKHTTLSLLSWIINSRSSLENQMIPSKPELSWQWCRWENQQRICSIDRDRRLWRLNSLTQARPLCLHGPLNRPRLIHWPCVWAACKTWGQVMSAPVLEPTHPHFPLNGVGVHEAGLFMQRPSDRRQRSTRHLITGHVRSFLCCVADKM